MLCAPVPHGEADRPLIGVVQLINKQGGGAFDAEDEALLHDFCVHVGLALTALLLRQDTPLFNRQDHHQDQDRQDQGRDQEEETEAERQQPNDGAARANPFSSGAWEGRPRALSMGRSPAADRGPAASAPSTGRKRGHYSAVETHVETHEDSSSFKRGRLKAVRTSPTRRALPAPALPALLASRRACAVS